MSINRMVLVGLLVLFSTACGGPRKACRSAEGLLAKAVQKCPELMESRTQRDTVTVYLPGSAGVGETEYTQADMDSVVKLCNELVNHMLRERSSGTQMTQKEGLTADKGSGDPRRSASSAPSAFHRLREELCALDPVSYEDSVLQLRIWTENNKLRYWYYVLPRSSKQVITTTTPQVVAKACPPEGVASWYRGGFWTLVVLLLLGIAFVALMVWHSVRANNPDHQG